MGVDLVAVNFVEVDIMGGHREYTIYVGVATQCNVTSIIRDSFSDSTGGLFSSETERAGDTGDTSISDIQYSD